ncbi:hypothetical protein IQ230_24870 [Gloeocapsopsis crepidinum LEGE 06123]|uniref:Uncharacterized protein n=1 Tax=Gloeocapsopsis crepidinum LEGE 06123 TaxID=588587 RepID=A0ABR9UYY8_9CHRO|nr:hypothetical protein [Gloeocapsopsis crepidinum LEGE 06123]
MVSIAIRENLGVAEQEYDTKPRSKEQFSDEGSRSWKTALQELALTPASLGKGHL